MPLPMVHLNIAIELLQSGYKANDLSRFFLGIISPDAIHMRKDAISDDKRKTHLSENIKLNGAAKMSYTTGTLGVIVLNWSKTIDNNILEV